MWNDLFIYLFILENVKNRIIFLFLYSEDFEDLYYSLGSENFFIRWRGINEWKNEN